MAVRREIGPDLFVGRMPFSYAPDVESISFVEPVGDEIVVYHYVVKNSSPHSPRSSSTVHGVVHGGIDALIEKGFIVPTLRQLSIHDRWGSRW